MKGANALLGACCIAWVASSCRHCEESDTVLVDFPPEIAKYGAVLRPGSWWAFTSTSGVTDSLFVYDWTETLSEELLGAPDCYRYKQWNMRISTMTMTDEGSVIAACATNSGTPYSSMGIDKLGIAFGNEGYEATSETFSHLESLTIGSETFNDVLITHSLDSIAKVQEVIFAAGIGPVRFVADGDTLIIHAYHVGP